MKIFYCDVETTGLDPYECGITQFAGIFEQDNAIIDSIDIRMRPFTSDKIEPQALNISGHDILKGVHPVVAFGKIEKFLQKYIDRFDKSDKAYICGYNLAGFDLVFLVNYFKKCGSDYIGSYFDLKCPLDPLPVLRFLSLHRPLEHLENFKLSSVCEYFGIKLDNAHDAMADIAATRAVYKKTVKLIGTT